MDQPIINAVMEGNEIVIYTPIGRKKQYAGSSIELVGFNEHYYVTRERGFVKIYNWLGSTHAVISISESERALSVSGNRIIIQSGYFYKTYNMEGQSIGVQQI